MTSTIANTIQDCLMTSRNQCALMLGAQFISVSHVYCNRILVISFFNFMISHFSFFFSLADTSMALDRKHGIHYFTSIIRMISYWSPRAAMEKVGANCKMHAATKITENTIGKLFIATSHRMDMIYPEFLVYFRTN